MIIWRQVNFYQDRCFRETDCGVCLGDCLEYFRDRMKITEFCTGQHHLLQTSYYCERFCGRMSFIRAVSLLVRGDCFAAKKTAARNDGQFV
jgi:hypothetical protein